MLASTRVRLSERKRGQAYFPLVNERLFDEFLVA